MLHVVESQKTVVEIAGRFEEVCKRHKFGVLGVHDLRKKMEEKGVPFDRECLIFEVCNPHQAQKVLAANMSISTALPCRVSVYEEAGTTRIATLKPTAVLGMYGSAELQVVAEEVERTILRIMDELA